MAVPCGRRKVMRHARSRGNRHVTIAIGDRPVTRWRRLRLPIVLATASCTVATLTAIVETPASEAGQEVAVGAAADDCGRRRTKADGTRWRCTFADDFDGSELDTSKWLAQQTATTGITNGTQGCYIHSPQTIRVVDGRLRLIARRLDQEFRCESPLGGFWTRLASAAVTTRGRFSQAYGRFAFRAKMPGARVAGAHTALWLYPNAHTYGVWPHSGEVDVAEWYSALPRQVFPSVHYVDGASNVHSGDATIANVSRFHSYALEWTPTAMRFYYDGDLAYQHAWDPADPLESPQPFDQPFNVVLSQVWGGLWNAPTASTPDVNRLVVDWVRVWE